MIGEDGKSRPAGGGSSNTFIPTEHSTGIVGGSAVLEAALRYAENGINVFPARLYVRGNNKKGVQPVSNWDEVSTTNPEVIRSWFTGQWADAALCIDCGKSGIVGVDQDVAGGKDGLVEWEKLDPPPTWRVRSPSGGAHDYYRADPDHPFTVDNTGAVADGVDVRGMGGFLFAPPSVDPRGGAWQWVAGEPDWANLPMVPEVVIKRMEGASARKRPKVTPASLVAAMPKFEPQPFDSLFMQPSQDFGPGAGYKKRSKAAALLMGKLEDFLALTQEGSGRSSFLAQQLAVLAGHGVDVFWTYDSALETLLSACEENGFTAVHGEAYAQEQASRGLEYGMRELWIATPEDEPVTTVAPLERKSRRMDLRAFLDGTYAPPVPSVGMPRSDGKCLLYPARWHTIIGPNGTGKSFFALACAIDELRKGNTVIYAHFEESDPGGTIMRLRAMAPDITTEMIVERFIWLDCSTRWTSVEWTEDIRDGDPSLVILDGINDATTRQGWDPSEINAPGNYADLFVTPCRVAGAAVLSLGHPPKAKGRETERHGYGSTAWLDKLEGVGFRLLPSKKRIREGHHGYAMLYSVKDRYGQVEKGLEPADGKDMDGWYVVGSFWVDSTTPDRSTYGIKPTELNEEGNKKDTIDILGEGILSALENTIAQDGAFTSLRNLTAILREAGVKFGSDDLEPAVDRLHRRGALNSPQVAARKPRPGALTVLSPAPHEDLDSELI